MTDKICTAKHTVFQPEDGQWACPKCGAGSNSKDPFVIEDSEEGAYYDCGKLHPNDYIHCYNCNKGWNGIALSKTMMKKANRQPCPTCKGCGTIPGGS